MRLKIISGGQTGADRTALEIARELGFPTGGFAPKGYLTEIGPDLSLRDLYGLEEHNSPKYPPRTKANVQCSDATIWFGRASSAGFRCTMSAVYELKKPYKINPTVTDLLEFIDGFGNELILNIAGNSLSKNQGIVQIVSRVLKPALLAHQLPEDVRKELIRVEKEYPLPLENDK